MDGLIEGNQCLYVYYFLLYFKQISRLMDQDLRLRYFEEPITHISVQKDGSLSEVTHAVHDTMRYGWRNVQTGSRTTHPVQAIQKHWEETEERRHYSMLKQVFGTHLPFRLQMEKNIVMQVNWPHLNM
jgi:hypothetical protein